MFILVQKQPQTIACAGPQKAEGHSWSSLSFNENTSQSIKLQKHNLTHLYEQVEIKVFSC